jgi:UDPglucose 6-dehydrogenase
MSAAPTIGFVGMTHLGLCSAVAAASKGFSTIGFDSDPELVRRLDAGQLPVVEPDLDNLLRAHRARISFSADADRLQHCDVVYVAPDVPTDDRGRSDLAPLERLLDLTFRHARADAVIVVLSQVPPGFTRSRQRPGRTLYYQVETLIFGRAVERATAPERFIVGCADPSVALPPPYRAFLGAFGCPILPMRFESAELTKISINCFLVASVSVTNSLAELCEHVGAQWSEIAPALRLDRRIGNYAYLNPGLGLAGGNLERDLETVIRFSEAHATDGGVIRAFIANSEHRKDWVWRRLQAELLAKTPAAAVGILGLAYKENTHSTKNSAAVALIRKIEAASVRVYDPVVPATAVAHPSLVAAPSALDAAKDADAVAIMTPWPEFRSLSCDALARAMRGRLVLDPYGMLDMAEALRAGLEYRKLGVG